MQIYNQNGVHNGRNYFMNLLFIYIKTHIKYLQKGIAKWDKEKTIYLLSNL